MVATQESRTTEFKLKLDGAFLDDTMMDAVEEIVVDENLHLPAMLSVRLHVNNHDWLDGSKLAEGKRIEAFADEHGDQKRLFVGKISAIELDMDEQHPVLTLRAYDLSYALHRIHKRRSFIQVTDSDVAQTLAGEAGLTPKIDSTSEVFSYLFQNNQSNFDFLRERALRIGYDCYCEDETFYFSTPHQTTGATTTLQWGRGLRRFRTRTTTFEPSDKVTVRGWDIKTKKEIIGQAAQPGGLPTLGAKSNGAQQSKSTWTASEFFVTDRVVDSQAEADKLAQSYLDELNGSFIEAEGLCFGQAAIRPRRQVKIEGVGQRFETTYTVTAARHVFTTTSGHQTSFVVSSRRAGTISELLDGNRPEPVWSGPIVGVVTNVDKDPDKMGRIKVKFPCLADDQESWWARIAAPFAGHGRGFNFLPEVNDEVLVVFEHGDMRRPIIIGNVWNGKDAPPVPKSLPRGRDQELIKSGGKIKQRLLKTGDDPSKGNMLIFNDSDDKPGLIMLGSSGAFIMIDDQTGDERITILDKLQNNRIEIRSQDESIHVICKGPAFIQADQDITVETKANLKATVQGNADVNVTGNLTMKATGNISIEATGSLSLKGMKVDISADTEVAVKGLTINVDGSATTTVKGGMVNVNGSGPVSVSGTPIKLN